MASARGDWDTAGKLLRGLVEQDEANYAVRLVPSGRVAYTAKSRANETLFFWAQAVNNLAVALLGQGKLKEGIQVLETALESSPSTLAMAEPFLFNLCALKIFRPPAHPLSFHIIT